MRRSLCLALLLAVAGCSPSPYAEFTPSGVPEVAVELRLATDTPREGAAEVVLPDSTQTIYLSPTVEFTNADIERTRVVIDKDDSELHSMVHVRLRRDAGARMAQLTRDHPKEMVAILLDGKVVMAPVIADEMAADLMVTPANMTHGEVVTLARNLAGRK